MRASIEQFLSEHTLALSLIAGGTLILFIGAAIIVPMIIVKMDKAYFTLEHRQKDSWRIRHPALKPIIMFIRNCLGVLLVLVGIIMLLTPGQGLLTILVGVMVMDFPGKFNLERKFIGWGPVFRGVNWLRRKFDREPLVLE